MRSVAVLRFHQEIEGIFETYDLAMDHLNLMRDSGDTRAPHMVVDVWPIERRISLRSSRARGVRP